jgi:regulator of protease activity HflC (stomatin/prohibitin superfamily)
MTTPATTTVWHADDHVLARTITSADVQGFFSRNLEIRPGTRTIVFHGHSALGEVPPGTYTLETFAERLAFWNRKAFTAVVIRSEDLPLTIHSGPVLTSDGLLINATAQLTLKVADPALFFANLLGQTAEYSMLQLLDFIQPLLQNAVDAFISARTLLQLRGPEITQLLDANIATSIRAALQRYGLQITLAHTLRISHTRYDELLRTEAEVVLLERENAAAAKLADRQNDSAWQQILKESREQQLEIARRQLSVDKLSSELSETQRRVHLRRELRDAVLSDEFDKLNTAEERVKFMHERGLREMLRADECRQLEDSLRLAGDDRANARRMFLMRLQLEQEHELQILRIDFSSQLEFRRRQAEIDAARRNDDESTRRWRAQLEREVEGAEHQRQEKWKAWRDRRDRFTEYWQAKRTDEIAALLHDTERSRITGDVQLRCAELDNRLKFLAEEQKNQLYTSELARQRALRDFDLETRERQMRLQREQALADDRAKLEIERERARLEREREEIERNDRISDEDRRSKRLQMILEQNRLQDRELLEQRALNEQKQHEREQETKDRETQRRRMIDTDNHARRMEELQFKAELDRLLLEQKNAFELRRIELENLKVSSLAGQSFETLIAASSPEIATRLSDVAIAKINAERDARTAQTQAEAAARTAEAHASAAIAAANATTNTAAVAQNSAEIAQFRAERDAAEARERQARQDHIQSTEAALKRLEQAADRQFHSTLGLAESAIRQQPPAQPAPVIVPPVVIPQGAPAVTVMPTQQPQYNPVHVHPTVHMGAPSGGTPRARFCTQCGNPAAIDHRFCSSCGTKLS